MRRREFIALLGGAAAVAARGARAAGRAGAADRRADRLGRGRSARQGRFAAFLQGLQQLGWTDGRNVQIDIRWGAGNAEDMRKYAAELVALAPDVMLATGGTTVGPLLQATRTVPIVFANVPDPVGSGFVDSLAQPGGNATGFMQFEYSLSGKWLELLKADRAGRDASGGHSGSCHHPPGSASSPSFSLWRRRSAWRCSPINVRDAGEIERGVAAFARSAEWWPDRDGERVGDLFIAI